MARKKPEPGCGSGVSRRSFITSLGVSAAGAMVATVCGPGPAAADSEAPLTPAGGLLPVTLVVNGRRHQLLVEPRWSLLFVLRDKLGLTGAKAGCERGECGACTVLIDDQPRYACLTLAVDAAGQRIVTVEGLLDGERLGPVQEAFAKHDAFQCGYCTPGQVMAVEGMLRAGPPPDEAAVRTGLSGNLCRCGAYANIVTAAQAAAAARKGGPS